MESVGRLQIDTFCLARNSQGLVSRLLYVINYNCIRINIGTNYRFLVGRQPSSAFPDYLVLSSTYRIRFSKRYPPYRKDFDVFPKHSLF